MTFRVEYLQAVEAEERPFPDVPGVTVTIVERRDDMGFPRVDVEADDREKLIAYVREEWGDEDPEWFRDYVVARVTQTDERKGLTRMAQVAAPPSVDLVKIGGGKTWHVLESVVDVPGSLPLTGGPITVPSQKAKTLCKQTGTIAERVDGIDARVESHRGAKVCAHCAAGGSLLSRKTSTETNDDQGEEPGKEADVATAEKKTSTRRASTRKTGAAKKTSTAKKSAAAREEKPVTAAELKTAIAKAEKAIGSQPSRTEVELTPAKADKAFKLGKSIAADRWLLKKAVAGKTSAATVAGMVERIEARVAERNAIRRGK